MKKILALALTLALILSAFAACGKEQQVVSSAEEEVSQEEASIVQEPPVSAAPEAVEMPVESEVEPAEMPQSAISFPLDETETLTYWHDYNTQIIPYVEGENYDNLPAFQAAEEVTNVHIANVVVSQDAESEQFNLMAASGDYTDLIKKATDLYSKGAIAVLDDGVIIDLAPYLEEYGPNYLAALNSVEGYVRDATTDDGRIPTFITVYANGLDPSQGIWVRKDLLEKAGLGIPHTYDELTEVMRGLRDYGVQEPLYLNPTGVLPNNVLAAGYGVAVNLDFGRGAGSTEPFYQVDGVVKFGALEDGWLDYFSMVRDWYAEGLISSDFVSNTGNAMDPNFMSHVAAGKTAIFSAPPIIVEVIAAAGRDYDPDFALEPIPDIVKEEGDQTHFGLAGVSIMTEGLSVSGTCTNPELAVAWCDYWYTEEGQLMASWGQEGVSYEFDENGEPQWTEFITNNPDGITKMNMTSLYVMGVGTVNYVPTDTTGMEQYVIDALDIFMENKDDAYDIPATATFTSSESEEYSSIMGEISTYYNEMVMKLITGMEDLSVYDTFKQTLIDMGIKRCIELKQAMLDRYLSR